MTAKLWLAMLSDIQQKTNSSMVSFSLIKKLTKTPKTGISKLLEKVKNQA